MGKWGVKEGGQVPSSNTLTSNDSLSGLEVSHTGCSIPALMPVFPPSMRSSCSIYLRFECY